jgi:hypothetical protein
MTSFNPPWQDLIHMYKKDVSANGAVQRTKGVSHRAALA